MLDLTKPVRMKNGIPIEILTTSLMGSYSILGKHQEKYYLWKSDGLCLLDAYARLVILKMCRKKERYG